MKYTLHGLGLALTLALSSAASAAGDASAGRAKGDTCLGCHGIPSYQNTYPTYRVPKLAGQNAEYIVAALQAYKRGERQHPTMSPQAQSMSEQDMQDIAAWISQMEVK